MRGNRRLLPEPVVREQQQGRWLDLLDRQAGMVSSAQLAEFGVSWATVRAQVDAGRWSRHVHSVYATFTGPPPHAALLAGALLYGGPAAVLSHRTAAEQWGLVRPGAGPVHLTVPYGASAHSRPGQIVVHRSRAYRHIVIRTDPPRTSKADTAVDLAVESDDAVSARTTLVRLMTGGRISPVDVEHCLTVRPPRRYRRALRAAVDMVRHGVQSALEELYLVRVERAHGLPAARRQTPFSVDGQTLWEDVTYAVGRETLTVRLDGRLHIRADIAFRDRRRDNAAELAGRARLVFGWDELDADPCAAARDVAHVLHRLGWTGRLDRCPACAS